MSVAENTIVSPANSYGLINGGIDGLYKDYFGDVLQRNILDAFSIRYPNGLLPVGSAILVETGNVKIPYMISAPTMESPGPVRPINAFLAMNAMLKVAEQYRSMITKVYCPGLATGIGLVPEEESAQEMASAYKKYLNRNGLY